MVLDFNHRPTLADVVEREFQKHVPAPRSRKYLGASEMGNACNRSLQLNYTGQQQDKPLTARTQRIFDRGHWGEAYMAKILNQAGFIIATVDRNGYQFKYEDMGGEFQGHTDGIIYNVPREFPIKYMADKAGIWENKVLGAKGFKEVSKGNLKETKPEYYSQIQLYQGYLNKTEMPAFFTALNADTMEVYVELVRFNVADAQAVIDRAAVVLQSTQHRQLLPRISEDQTAFACLFCKYKETCKVLSELPEF